MNIKDLAKKNSKRRITQICFVSEDYQKTIEYLYEKLNYGPWTIMAHSNEVTKDVELDGKTINTPFKFYCAFTYIGDMEIEVIQPEYGDNPYSEYLEKRGPGIHHIKETIKDKNELDHFVEENYKNGLDIFFKGSYLEDRFYYYNLMDGIGSMYEFGNSAGVENHPILVGHYPES